MVYKDYKVHRVLKELLERRVFKVVRALKVLKAHKVVKGYREDKA